MNEQPLDTIVPSEPVCIIAFICNAFWVVLAWLHSQLCVELTQGIMLSFSFTLSHKDVALQLWMSCRELNVCVCVWYVHVRTRFIDAILTVCVAPVLWSDPSGNMLLSRCSDQMNVNRKTGCKKEMYACMLNECVRLCLLISDNLCRATISLNLIEHIPVQCAYIYMNYMNKESH